MNSADRDALQGRLAGIMEVHRASWARQMIVTPYQTLRRMTLARLANRDRITGRHRTLRCYSFFDELVAYPFPACWDIRIYKTYCDEAELRLLSYLIGHLPAGGVFFDVGANIGLFSMLASKIVGPDGAVYAFEPGADALDHLEENLGDMANATIVKAAAMERPGEITFFEGQGASMVSSSAVRTHLVDRNSDIREVRVPATSLDSFCAEHGLTPDLVKIDVEGAELSVLKGATELLEAGQTGIVLEVSFVPEEFETQYAPCIALLEDHGYRMHALDADGQPRLLSGDILRNHAPNCSVARGYLHNLDNLLFLPPQ